MAKEIVINIEDQEKRVAFVENKALEEYYFERPENKRLTGNIYRGKVVKIMPGIQAAFVNIGLRKNGFLHISDITDDKKIYEEIAGEELDVVEEGAAPSLKKSIEDYLKVNEFILVQVVKDSIGTKGPRLSTNISLPGKYVVLLPKSSRKGISRRIIDSKERERLKQIIDNLPVPKSMGIIIRTFAQEKTKRDCAKDLKLLVYLWKKIHRRYKNADKPTLIHAETDLVKRIIRDALTEEVNKIIVDSKKEYKEIRKYVGSLLPKGKSRVILYEGEEPIFESYNIEKEIEKVFRKKVWLKCGGYLVIEQTEALVAIDVNTGKNIGKNKVEETILDTNLEAAAEIGRQLRLRNMGGLIVIDFIDMRSKTNQKLVVEELQKALKRDKARTRVLAISELGLVEMTRERDKESVGETVYGECPYCSGTGTVKLVETVSIEIQRELKKLVLQKVDTDFKICAHPDVIERLKKEDFPVVEKILRRSKINIEFLPVTDYHLEEWNCYSTRTDSTIDK